MDFLKKLFGGKKEEAPSAPEMGGEATFVCEKCGATRKESERKEHLAEHEQGKNVCKFC